MNIKGFEHLKYIFEKNLDVGLISEEMDVCSIEDNAADVKKELEEQDFDIYGVEENGSIVGYVNQDDLDEGVIKDYYKQFSTDDLISDSTSLIDLLKVFKNRGYVFILEKNEVKQIVTMADLHKEPMRLLAFSLVSLLEINLTSIIVKIYPDDNWVQHLTEGRIKAAKNTLDELSKKNEALTLIECTQFCDKGTIVKEMEQLREDFGFSSKNKCKEFFDDAQNLRNNVAHAQKALYRDSQKLIKIMLEIKRVLEATESMS